MTRARGAFGRALALRLLPALAALAPLCGAAAEPPAAAAAAAAPDFSRPDLAGHTLQLSALRGKVVLLNFWATWCGPCLAEVPRFAQWQRRDGGRGLRVVGVSMDDDQAPVRAAYAKYRLNYPVVMGDAPLGELYGGVYGLPLSLLIDRGGRIRFRHQGAADLEQIEGELAALLAEPAR